MKKSKQTSSSLSGKPLGRHKALKRKVDKLKRRFSRPKVKIPVDAVEFFTDVLRIKPYPYPAAFLEDPNPLKVLRWCRRAGKTTVMSGADKITSKLDFRATNVITEKGTRTSPFSTTSTSYVDMGLSVDITVQYAANVLVFEQWCYMRNYAAGKTTYMSLFRGTTEVKQLILYGNYADYRFNSSLTYMDVNLATGTYTFKMRAKVSGGTGYWCGGTDELTAYIVAQSTKS